MRSTLLLLPLLLAADWPQHLGPKRDGHSPETGLLRDWPKGGPAVVWKRDVGSGWSGPVVAGGKLILFHRVEEQEVVECLDAATGKPLWKSGSKTRYRDDFNFDDGPRATPLIADGQVVTLGADGDFTARDLATGKERWTTNLNADFEVEKGFFGVATSPILVAGKIFVNVGTKAASVVAFDPKTGKVVGKCGNDGVSYSSPVAATFGGKDHVVFFTRAGLLVVNAETLKVTHQFPWRPRLNASVNAATPVVVGDRVFLSTSYGTGAVSLKLNGADVEEVWKGNGILSSHYCTPVYRDGTLYGIDGRAEGGRAELRSVDWATGKVHWKQVLGCANLIAADGLLIAVCESGSLKLIEPSPKAYTERATFDLMQAPVRALPALAEGILYARDGKTLYAVKLSK
jgi:outer membrane protein assembly factor BamB